MDKPYDVTKAKEETQSLETAVIPLGQPTSTTIDIKAKTDRYRELTADDFMIYGGGSVETFRTKVYYDQLVKRWCNTDIVKVYDAESGTLTLYLQGVNGWCWIDSGSGRYEYFSGNKKPVPYSIAIVLPDAPKEALGSAGRSWNLSSREDSATIMPSQIYMAFNSGQESGSSDSNYASGGSDGIQYVFSSSMGYSYNSVTGILSVSEYTRVQNWNVGEARWVGHDQQSVNNLSFTPYLIKSASYYAWK